jgi:hypothetical protein
MGMSVGQRMSKAAVKSFMSQGRQYEPEKKVYTRIGELGRRRTN